MYMRVELELKKYWDTRTPVIQQKASVRKSVPIPVVAIVHGHTQGDAAITVGYYDLYSDYVRYDNGTSSITINSLALNNYGLPEDDAQEVADKFLDAQEAFNKSSN